MTRVLADEDGTFHSLFEYLLDGLLKKLHLLLERIASLDE